MPKGFFFSLPSVSVDKSLTPVIEEIATAGFDIIYFNKAGFVPGGNRPFEFRAYPPCFSESYPGTIDKTTSYFQFAEILADTAISIMDFVLEEVEKERPDFIIYSHLAPWGKLAALHYKLPAIAFNTTFILDKRIMLPFFRRINAGKPSSQRNIQDMVTFGRKNQTLYSRLAAEAHPDPWDAYVNQGELNFSFILDVFQPMRHLFGEGYYFPGYPMEREQPEQEKKLIYIAMGTIVNDDIPFYRLCIDLVQELDLPCVLSIGAKADIGQLGPVPSSIRIETYSDQRTVLREALLFISRGGMASVHEAIHTLTPMIVVPVIPEQQITAERIQQLGIGLALLPEKVSRQALATAIRTILQGRKIYLQRLRALRGTVPAIPSAKKAAALLRDFLAEPPMGDRLKTVAGCFFRQAALHPEAIALRCGEETLTYQQLDKASDRLAHRLIEEGIAADAAIPVVMAPGIPIVIAILGITKAGAVYVPVDPHYPEERIDLILADTRATVVICSNQLAGRAYFEGRYVLLDPEQVTGQPGSSFSVRLPTPSQLAYIMYTSGSTGRPKGVMVEHAQLYRYTVDVYERMELGECESYAILGTFAADAGLTAVWCALSYGKCLDIADIRQFRHFDHIVSHFSNHPVDCYKITPSLLEWLRKQGDLQSVFPRRRLLLGGEACPLSLATSIRALLPRDCRMYNHYGPTETTIGVITYRFPDFVEEFPPLVPLGYPLPSVGIRILKENGDPAAHGEAGELYIEGALLARGYLNEPGLTEQKFLLHETANEKTRLYKSGDLARQLPDGHIEYICRTDDQVKIRGYRIELQEIGYAIEVSNMVKRNLVLPKKDKKGGVYLAAYVQPGEGYERPALIRLLKKKLPVYMIPSRWVELQEWPMTVNNKTDRRALPEPPDEEEAPEAALFNETEEELINIWERVLGIKKPGVERDFFELGGDSLKLLQLVYAIHDRLSLSVQSVLLFEYTTIRQQAAYLGTVQSADKDNIPAASTDFDEQQTSDAQRNMYFQYKLDSSRTLGGASLTFEIEGPVEIQRMEVVLGKLVDLFDDLNTGFFLEKGAVRKHRQKKSPLGLSSVTCLSNDIDAEIIALTAPFDLSQPPLLRVYLLQLSGGKRYLHACMPHINSDGESLKVLMDELVDLYNDKQQERPRLGFNDYLKNFQAYLGSKCFHEDELFWRKQLQAPLPLLNFGLPVRRETVSAYSGICRVSPFPDGLADAIRQCSRSTNSTPFRWLLAAHFLLLHKISDENRLGILIPVHNRNENGTDRIIGLLSNVLPVIMPVDGRQPLGEWLDEVRSALLSALAHQRYPFERTQRLWGQLGHNRKNLMQSFLGFHVHRPEYRPGRALLRPYFPAKNKENLYLSSAIFDTGDNFFLRMSSAAGATALSLLQEWSTLYFTILGRIVKSAATHPVASVVE